MILCTVFSNAEELIFVTEMTKENLTHIKRIIVKNFVALIASGEGAISKSLNDPKSKLHISFVPGESRMTILVADERNTVSR